MSDLPSFLTHPSNHYTTEMKTFSCTCKRNKRGRKIHFTFHYYFDIDNERAIFCIYFFFHKNIHFSLLAVSVESERPEHANIVKREIQLEKF